jgi:hypothetical protein
MFLAVVLLLVFSMPANAQTQGWVLIQPPHYALVWVGDSANVVDDTPIHDWEYISAHDNAAACERAKEITVKKWFDVAKEFKEPLKNDLGRAAIGLMHLGTKARCVPYDLWWSKQK